MSSQTDEWKLIFLRPCFLLALSVDEHSAYTHTHTRTAQLWKIIYLDFCPDEIVIYLQLYIVIAICIFFLNIFFRSIMHTNKNAKC